MPAAPSAEGCRPELALRPTAACGTPIRRPGSRTQKNSIVVVPLGPRGTPATTSLETQRDLIRFIQPNCQRAKPLRRQFAAKWFPCAGTTILARPPRVSTTPARNFLTISSPQVRGHFRHPTHRSSSGNVGVRRRDQVSEAICITLHGLERFAAPTECFGSRLTRSAGRNPFPPKALR